jgi:hypothetical protein
LIPVPLKVTVQPRFFDIEDLSCAQFRMKYTPWREFSPGALPQRKPQGKTR